LNYFKVFQTSSIKNKGGIMAEDFSDVTGSMSSAGDETKTYTVKKGDSLSKIAKEFYGDAKQWKKIYEANKDVIGNNPDLIKPGQEYVIPD
jgi:nucleoid-associated protein YgaU